MTPKEMKQPEQDICPKCRGFEQVLVKWGTQASWEKFPTCHGTGRDPQADTSATLSVNPKLREEIFETIYYHKFPNAVRYKIKPVLHDIASEVLADRIIALMEVKK